MQINFETRTEIAIYLIGGYSGEYAEEYQQLQHQLNKEEL